MSVNKRLTHKETILVRERAKGTKVLQAANKANYLPNATNETRRVEAHKTLQKPHVKDALETALLKHDITLDKALAPVSKALQATKIDYMTGEITDNLDLQLRASDRAIKLLGITEVTAPTLHLHLHKQTEQYDL